MTVDITSDNLRPDFPLECLLLLNEHPNLLGKQTSVVEHCQNFFLGYTNTIRRSKLNAFKKTAKEKKMPFLVDFFTFLLKNCKLREGSEIVMLTASVPEKFRKKKLDPSVNDTVKYLETMRKFKDATSAEVFNNLVDHVVSELTAMKY